MATGVGRIEEFTSLLGNPRSASNYRSAVRRYLDFIYGPVREGKIATPEEAQRYEELAEEYFTGDHNHAIDLQRFAASLNAARTPPKSAIFWLSIVKEFFKFSGVPVDDDLWRTVKRRGPKGRRARTQEATFDKGTIQKILPHMPLLAKAVFLTLISSGMRVGECLQLALKDFHLDEEPARIAIPGHIPKNGEPRITFISREAAAAIRDWLVVREDWMLSAANRNRGLLKHYGKEYMQKRIEGDDRLFPVQASTVREGFVGALEKVGLDEKDPKTNRFKIHLHMCRKYFRTVMAQRIPLDAVELMMGHDGYLTDAYVRYTDDELRQYYLQAEGAVCVGVADDVAAAVMGGRLDALIEENATLRAAAERTVALEGEVAGMRAALGGVVELLERNMEAEELRKRLGLVSFDQLSRS